MSSVTSSAEFDVALERWRFEVGRLILAFGEIEFGVCQCLVHIPETNQWELLKHQEFKVKASAAIKCTQESNLSANSKRRLVNALNQAMKLAVDRNLIAHNPLHLGMYTGDQGGIDFQLQIYSLRDNTKTMTLDELARVAESATDVASELIMLSGEAA